MTLFANKIILSVKSKFFSIKIFLQENQFFQENLIIDGEIRFQFGMSDKKLKRFPSSANQEGHVCAPPGIGVGFLRCHHLLKNFSAAATLC